MEGMLETAIEIAAQAHTGQVDQAGHPYILHPIAVMAMMDSVEDMTVAVLHDVIEDSALELDDLVAVGFPHEIVDSIDAITHRPHEPRAKYYTRINADERALRVKLKDIAHNMDPERMAQLDEATQKRLTLKYKTALGQLTPITHPARVHF